MGGRTGTEGEGHRNNEGVRGRGTRTIERGGQRGRAIGVGRGVHQDHREGRGQRGRAEGRAPGP